MVKSLVSVSNMAGNTNTLLVRHLPTELDKDDQVDLLQHFGAEHVRCMGSKGRMKHSAFVTFKNKESALAAMKKLHQLEILGSKLVVEFSKNCYEKYHPHVSVNLKKTEEKTKNEEKQDMEEKLYEEQEHISERINNIHTDFGFVYPLDPRFEYFYPPPTANVLINISHTLASVPKFYVQVLHLMNKMNLPAPFAEVTQTPPLPIETIPSAPPLPEEDVPEIPPEPVTSSEESELESEGEHDKNATTKPSSLKRPAIGGSLKPRKKHKLQPVTSAPKLTNKTSAQKPAEVFEQPEVIGARRIEFNLAAAISNVFEGAVASSVTNIPQIIASEDTLQTATLPNEGLYSSVDNEQPVVEVGGFGKIEPLPKPQDDNESDDQEEEWGDSEFISSRRLRKGRISSSEMQKISAFKNYAAGEPTTRLYLKNLSKQVVEKDIHYIYGRYVKWDSEMEKNMFDIRLMDGRMKGQAFVTLPNEKVAQQAVNDTHGFELHKKPMVVLFARSAKPKEKETKDSKQSKGGKQQNR